MWARRRDGVSSCEEVGGTLGPFREACGKQRVNEKGPRKMTQGRRTK